jgi:hypothetical protein
MGFWLERVAGEGLKEEERWRLDLVSFGFQLFFKMFFYLEIY